MIPALQALERLQEGNQRFASDAPDRRALLSSRARRSDLSSGQAPFAIILGCSDSRVPAEIVFDQGLGDLFVIRVAGNIVAPSQVASVEFAAERLASRLVVVLGHSQCGAVLATLEAMSGPARAPVRSADAPGGAADAARPHLRSIIDRIRPSVAPLLDGGRGPDPQGLIQDAVRANIRASAHQLRHGSPILESLIAHDGLAVVGAEYSLESGLVDFFDGVADAIGP